MENPQRVASLVYGNRILLLLGASVALFSGLHYLLQTGEPVSNVRSQPGAQVNFWVLSVSKSE